tara:strand:+ start:609 stop:761 length:153 start_codon:yes stop_codon:yes gene_type:complete
MLEKIYSRAMYVPQENTRTLKGALLIEQGRVQDFGLLMYQTHPFYQKNMK